MHLNFGISDIMKLLQFSSTSATPLTDLVIKNGAYSSANVEPGITFHHVEECVASSREMVLKVVLQKSTNKFLFAEATHEFLEFLFSFLVDPLGGVVSLLGGYTCLKNIDNLYRSVSDLIDSKYFISPDIKTRLMKPNVAHGCIPENQFLPLTQEAPPKRPTPPPIPYNGTMKYGVESSMFTPFKSLKGMENFVKKQTTCFVADDLTVSPSLATSIWVIIGEGISVSDLIEIEFQIGLEEALRILRASLTSNTVLTDALINPILDYLA